MFQIAHKERELEEMRRVVERSAGHHSDAAAKPHLISQLRAKDDQIKVSNFLFNNIVTDSCDMIMCLF